MNGFAIETRGLTKIYGGQKAVDGVDLHVGKGRVYGLLGRNGAGKTTVMKMILGLTSITSVSYTHLDVYKRQLHGRITC